MAIKDHPKYLELIDRLVDSLKIRTRQTGIGNNEFSRYLQHVFTRNLNDDQNISTSDKAHLKDKLYNKLQAILLKS